MQRTPLKKKEIDRSLDAIYQEADRLASRIATNLGERITCRPGCISCCLDDITVFDVEAENIRHHYPSLLQTEIPHPLGGCAFLDEEGRCRIYEHRPYVCRTQGLPLRWLEEREDGQVLEMRDICPLNEKGRPLEELAAEECWTIGPFEERLAMLQHTQFEGIMKRVTLREIFRSK